MDPRAPLTVDQAAEHLRCTPDTVRELAGQGVLAGIKLGRDWVFPAGAFFASLDSLATEQAKMRRAPPPAASTHVLHQVPAAPRKGTRQRALPALPAIG